MILTYTQTLIIFMKHEGTNVCFNLFLSFCLQHEKWWNSLLRNIAWSGKDKDDLILYNFPTKLCIIIIIVQKSIEMNYELIVVVIHKTIFIHLHNAYINSNNNDNDNVFKSFISFCFSFKLVLMRVRADSFASSNSILRRDKNSLN